MQNCQVLFYLILLNHIVCIDFGFSNEIVMRSQPVQVRNERFLANYIGLLKVKAKKALLQKVLWRLLTDFTLVSQIG